LHIESYQPETLDKNDAEADQQLKHHESAAYITDLILRLQVGDKIREAHESIHYQHQHALIKNFESILGHPSCEWLDMADHDDLGGDEEYHCENLDNQVLVVDHRERNQCSSRIE
jgi:hypothetical protein